MTDYGAKLSKFWQDSVNVVLGLWLILSPWALAYSGQAMATWNAWIVGAIIAVAATAALVAFHQWEEWVNMALAAWLILSPWLLGLTGFPAAMWNQIIIGVLVGGLAIWSYMRFDDATLSRQS